LLNGKKTYDNLPEEQQKVGFYGLDVYSLSESMESVIKYLKKVDQLKPIAALNPMEEV
jgi:erythromycin esterase-like protein